MDYPRWREYLAFLKEHPYREQNGVPYIETGDGGGPPLLFLHGTLGAGDIWWQQIRVLAPAHRIVAPTYPRTEGLADLANRILGLMDALGIDRFIPIGTSMGGYLAQYLVAHRPERIAAAVFANTLPPYLSIRLRVWTRVLLYGLVPEERLFKQLRRFAENMVFLYEGANPFHRDYLLNALEKIDKATFLNRYRIMVTPFRVPEPEVPHLVIYSRGDQVIPRPIVERMLEAYPEAQKVELWGHFSYLSRPDKFTGALRWFFQNHVAALSPPSNT